jgi:hypothetical protein
MTLFISKKNQNFLWKIVNNNKNIINMESEFKTNWFQQTIGIYYDKYKETELTLTELPGINKEFVEHIKKDMIFIKEYNQKEQLRLEKEKEEEDEEQRLYEEKLRKQQESAYINTTNMELKKNELNQDLIQKQKEFDDLLQTKNPEEINFTEKDDKEGAIQNMDELIKQQQIERESVDKETHIMYDKYVKANNLLEEKEEKEGKEGKDIEVLEPT